jgi:hypothetical protein
MAAGSSLSMPIAAQRSASRFPIALEADRHAAFRKCTSVMDHSVAQVQSPVAGRVERTHREESMSTRLLAALTTSSLALLSAAGTALAQRPTGSQGPPQMSLERGWDWLTARPGVMIALLIIAAAIAYMIITRKKSKADG